MYSYKTDKSYTGPFAPLHGLRFFAGREARHLEVGTYPNGRVAIGVFDGQILEQKLTVNLDGVVLAEDQILVPQGSAGRPISEDQHVRCHGALLHTGLFVELSEDIPAGYVERYAKRWQLAKIHGRYLVQDPQYMLELDEDFMLIVQQMDAEKVERAIMKGMHP